MSIEMCEFIKIKYDGDLIKNWQYISVNKSDSTRVYFKPSNEKDQGFEFCVVEVDSSSGDFKDCFQDPQLRVSLTITGNAFFDGIRHLYVHSGDSEGLLNYEIKSLENDGYLYYPSVKKISKICKILETLEDTYCSQYELDRSE